MAPFPLPVNLFLHYSTMIHQINSGSYPDPFGLESIRINRELHAIIGNLDGRASGLHLILRLNSGELIISGSVQDLQSLSNVVSIEQITYYGLADQNVVDALRGIAYG